MRVIGWDVGGAHLKAALAEDGRILRTLQVPMPLWQGITHLHDALRHCLAQLGAADRHAATMTGELCDLFANRAEGVAAITQALREATAPAPLTLYAGAAGFVPPDDAAEHAAQIASANFHASAALAARAVPDALLVDIGSTTTDIVPLRAGRVAALGQTDAARLAAGELVYTGLTRSFVMALTDRAPFAGAWTPLAGEYFASTADVYRVLGELDEAADMLPTADGREKTVAASRARLARMIGRDAADGDDAAWHALAAWLAEQQLRRIADAAALVLTRAALPATAPVLGAGTGRHLAARLAARIGRPYAEFPAAAPVGAADCAPAVAVALLAS